MVRTVILGCGNLLRGDDGFGCHVAQRLMHLNRDRPGIRVIDAGSAAGPYINLIASEKDPPELIVVDAGRYGADEGELHVFQSADLHRVDNGHSLHGWPLATELSRYPGKAHVLLCQVPERGIGSMKMHMSDEVHDAIPRACTMACDLAGVRP